MAWLGQVACRWLQCLGSRLATAPHPTLPPFQDASDRAIISGNMNLIWAWAATVPTMPSGGNGWLPMHDNRGSMTLNLLGGAEV